MTEQCNASFPFPKSVLFNHVTPPVSYVTHSSTHSMRRRHLAPTAPPRSPPRSLQTPDTTPSSWIWSGGAAGRECCLSTQMQATLSQFPGRGDFLLTCCDVGPHLSAVTSVTPFRHARLHYASERRFASQVFGGGTPQRDSSQSATRCEFCSCFGENLSDLSNFYSRILVITGRMSFSPQAES